LKHINIDMYLTRNKNYIWFPAFLLLLGVFSCFRTIPAATVTQPDLNNLDKLENVQIVNLPFEQVWTSLIEYSASTFFAIKNFEKDSGLITLQFGSDNPSTYIDCGYLEQQGTQNNGPTIEVLQKWGTSVLDGSMNIFVKEISPNRTQITINSRYIFTHVDPTVRWVWSFDSGGYDSVRHGTIVLTCMPTHVAEQKILDGVMKLLNDNTVNTINQQSVNSN